MLLALSTKKDSIIELIWKKNYNKITDNLYDK